MSQALVKLQKKGQMVIPRSLREQALQELAQVVAELRQEAREKGLDKMPKREINTAVAAARRDLKKSSKRHMK